MKIKNGFTLHQIGDEHIIMHNGTGNVDFSNIISLNPTATRLWQHVEGTDFNTDTLTDFLTENYEVDAETAKRDAEQFPVFNSRSFPSNPCQLSSLSTRWNRCQSQ